MKGSRRTAATLPRLRKLTVYSVVVLTLLQMTTQQNPNLIDKDNTNILPGQPGYISNFVEFEGVMYDLNNVASLPVSLATCGNAVKISAEECDDGNKISLDGCSLTCKVEVGFDCITVDGQLSVCTEICGDGRNYRKISPFATACDDGNSYDNDGCDSGCQEEDYWSCTGGTNKLPDTCVEICGDGVNYCGDSTLDCDGYEGAQCDDANTADGDGCNSDCIIEAGWVCDPVGGYGSSGTSTCSEICGDGLNPGSNNDCDVGTAPSDGCINCVIQYGWECSGGDETGPDTCSETCGDGYSYAQACDDGNYDDWDGCSSSCEVEEGFYLNCSPCADDEVSIMAELCDGYDYGNFECDCGEYDSSDPNGCTGCSFCVQDEGWDCIPNEYPSDGSLCFDECGDGYLNVDTIEDNCDDADDTLGVYDGCNYCKVVEGWECDVDAEYKSYCYEISGDGKDYGTFECDNYDASYDTYGYTDGCYDGQYEFGFTCWGGTYDNGGDVCYEICGDGYDFNTLECEDGNQYDGDGCSSLCEMEPGFFCDGGDYDYDTVDECVTSPIGTGTLTDCQAYADLFYNTCDDFDAFGILQPADSVNVITYSEESCDSGYGKCMGSTDGAGVCYWERRLCVTCRREMGQTLIRVQSNSLPDHCFQASDVTIVENNIDFEVYFAAISVTEDLPSITIQGQTQLDDKLCSSQWPLSAETASFLEPVHYNEIGGNLDLVVGVALNGVPIHSGISELGFDAFYPKTYQGTAAQSIPVDYCLGNNKYSDYYHYYSMSPCIIDGTIKEELGKSCSGHSSCKNKQKTHMRTLHADYQTLIPVGIAKSGHKIYGPYDENGKLWQPCDVDVCNGLIINDEYAYVMTTFFPYTVGCMAQGNSPQFNPSCTENPRKCAGSFAYVAASPALMLLALMSMLYIVLQ